MKAKRATSQLNRFEAFCGTCSVLPLTGEIVERAADIYGDLYQAGALIGDADILIAATALHHNLELSTNNEAHFRRITGLRVVNWMSST